MSSTNGKASTSGPYRAPAIPVLGEDPLARVLDTGSRVPGEAMIAGAILLHVVMGAGAIAVGLYEDIHAWQRGIRDVVAYSLSQYEMDVVKEPPPPPPPEPEKPPEPEPEKAPPPPTQKDEPPPPPTEAAKVLTQEPKPEEPVDLTGNTFVTGNSDSFKGGQASTNGKGDKPVYNPAAANNGVVGGTGTAPVQAPAPPKDDKSRSAGLLGSSDWNDCPFPGEADAEQIDRQAVLIKVHVKPDGSPESVDVVQDPGHGFGREARKCAMRKKYAPGLDPNGNPIGSITKPFRVRFER
jgi:protein TonB